MIPRATLICGALAAALAGLAGTAAGADNGYIIQRGELRHEGRVWVQEMSVQMPLREGARITLIADEGSIEVHPLPAGGQLPAYCKLVMMVHGGSESEAREAVANYEFNAKPTADGAMLRGRYAHRARLERGLYVRIERRHNVQPTFYLTPQLRTNLNLQTSGGTITVERLDGELLAHTAGGDIVTGQVMGTVHADTAGGAIRLGDIGQSVNARTAGGAIHVGNVGGEAVLDTAGGDIVAGIVGGGIEAKTAGGDIYLRAVSGPVNVHTAGGQIRLGECGGSVQAETSGGNIRLDGARGQVQAKTAGGSIDMMQLMSGVQATTSAGRILAQISAGRGQFTPSRLETSVGDVDVYLPANLGLQIDAVIEQGAGHKIISDFPLTVEGAHQFPTGTLRAHGSLQGGGSELGIRTSMGNILLKKINPMDVERLKNYEQTFWRQFESQQQVRDQLRKALEDRTRLMVPAFDQQAAQQQVVIQRDQSRQIQELQKSMEEQARQLQQQMQQLQQQLQEEMRKLREQNQL